MFIKGETIYLRALEPSDAGILYHWENNMQLWPVSFTQVPFSMFVLEEFVNAAHQDIYTNKQLRLMACRIHDNKAVGIIDLFEFDPQHVRCGLGIYIDEAERKKGYAAEVLRLVQTYAFSVLHLKQLFVHISAGNEASLALFQRSGFEKSGLKKCWQKTGLDKFEDVWFLQCIHQQ